MSGSDQAKFAQAVMPYLSEAFGLARWISGNRSDAEDITQEACLRAYRAINSCRGDQPRAWLLSIVRNTAHSWLAKNRNFKLIGTDDLNFSEQEQVELGGTLLDAHERSPEASLLAKADANSLEKEIALLPNAFREVIVMRDLQGLSYHEIASVIGVPIGTVMSRLARGRARLIARLAREQAS